MSTARHQSNKTLDTNAAFASLRRHRSALRSAIMRSIMIIGAAGLLGCCLGCRVFYREKVTAGYRYSKEAIDFLGRPGTTREDVLSSFGPALIDSPSDGVLAYEWEVTRKVLMPTFDLNEDLRPVYSARKQRMGPSRYGLFIAYDELQLVRRCEVVNIQGNSLQEECIRWRNRLQIR